MSKPAVPDQRRGPESESEALLRQIDNQLATLKGRRRVDLALAERIADMLRQLVRDTAVASAADRARARAAVHYFFIRWDGRPQRRRPPRPLTEDVRVLNQISTDLGREDLLISL